MGCTQSTIAVVPTFLDAPSAPRPELLLSDSYPPSQVGDSVSLDAGAGASSGPPQPPLVRSAATSIDDVVAFLSAKGVLAEDPVIQALMYSYLRDPALAPPGQVALYKKRQRVALKLTRLVNGGEHGAFYRGPELCGTLVILNFADAVQSTRCPRLASA